MTNNMGTRNPRSGAKAVTWDWQRLTTTFSTGKRCYELTEQQVAFLATVFQQAMWGTRWFNQPDDFNDIIQFVIQTDVALSTPVKCSDEKTLECEENMSCKLPIYFFDGIPYLLIDDCCNEPVWAQLTVAPVDSGGTPQPALLGGGESALWQNTNPLSTGNYGCYATEATAYLLGRARAFTIAVAQWTTLGTNFFFASDDIYNPVAVVSAILFGEEFQDIEDKSTAYVNNAFDDAAFNNSMEAAWNTSLTYVTKSDLNNWRQAAPQIVNFLPMRSQLGSWINYIDMDDINANLALIRAQCESGNAAPPELPFNYDWQYEWDFTLDANGTGTASGGWFTVSTQAVYENGIGWKGGGSGATDHICRIRTNSLNGRTVTGSIFTLDAGMGGDSNLIGIYRENGATTVVQESRPGEVNIVSDDAYTPTANVDYALAEFNFNGAGGDTFTKRLKKITVFGTGAVPVDGFAV